MPTLYERVVAILTDSLVLGEDEVTLSSRLVADLNADDLDLAEIFDALEEDFGHLVDGLKFETSEEEQIDTVEDIINLLRMKQVPEVIPEPIFS